MFRQILIGKPSFQYNHLGITDDVQALIIDKVSLFSIKKATI